MHCYLEYYCLLNLTQTGTTSLSFSLQRKDCLCVLSLFLNENFFLQAKGMVLGYSILKDILKYF